MKAVDLPVRRRRTLAARKRWCVADWLPVVIGLNGAMSIVAMVGTASLGGGQRNSLCTTGVIAFWAGASLVLRRHHKGLDKPDWTYLLAGQVLCILAFYCGWAVFARYWLKIPG